MKPHFIIVFLLAASTLMMSAQTQPDTNVVVKAKSKPKAKEPHDGKPEYDKFVAAVKQLWQQGDIDSLEKMGSQLFEIKERFNSGLYKLSAYLEGIGAIGSGDDGFLAAEKQVKAWEEKYTNSVIAPVVEGEILSSHAWFFRGNSYGDTVTASGWTNFSIYLSKAEQVLEKSKTRCAVCPGWYEAMLWVGIGQSWDTARFDRIFEDGVKIDPDYVPLYTTRATSLLPRWYGSKGEWQAFAEIESEKHGAELYARIAMFLSSYYDAKSLFADGGISWDKMKVSFVKLIEKYPDSLWYLNRYCRFACLAGDREKAKELFAKIGRNRHPQCWAQKEFNQYKQWAIKSE